MLDSLDITYDLSLTVYVPDQEKEIEKLKTRANVSKTFGFLASAKNYDALAKYSEIDSLITEIKSSSQKLAYYSLSFLIRDRKYQYLRNKQNKILESFPSLGSAEGIVDHMNHDQLYLSFLPGQGWMNPRKYLIQTDALANILPIQSEWQGSSKAMALLKTRKRELLKLDLFDETLPAKHGIVLGTTGSGKSFATNYLLTSYLLQDPKNQLVVIDVGKSYRRLAATLGGTYLDIDLGENYAINPLLHKSMLYKNGAIDSESLSYLTLIVEKLSKAKPDDVLTNAHKRVIEKAILQMYEKRNAPILSDLVEALRSYSVGDDADKARAREFAKNLSLWTENQYGKLLNRQGNVDTSRRFVVFELGKLDAHPDLQSIVFFVIRTAIANKLNNPDTRKVIVIDEGWRFFNDDTSARLIEDLYRTSRKFNGLVLSISQSPEDFLNTKAANAIISNSFTKYILKLNKGHELLSRFDLNDSEVNEAKTLISRPGIFSELFVKYGENSIVARIEPTALEYWLATTDPQDIQLEDQLRKENPGLDVCALIQKLAIKYPRGISRYAQTR
jgi:type IV secretory pathway VirB4 component